MRRNPRFTQYLAGNAGFTLLEVIIVIVIISIMTLLVAPRISNFFTGSKGSFIVLTTMLAKTFDDSFVKDRMNFLMVHLNDAGTELHEANQDLFSRRNGISVVTLEDDGKFTDSMNKLLKYREFPSSFKFEEVVLSTGEKVRNGNVVIPFYPQGFSDNVVMHILVNDEDRWSVRLYKLKKEPKAFPGFIEMPLRVTR